MKVKNIKKALSLFLAVLMIALALPLTMLPVAAEETTNTTATTIKYAKLFAKYDDGYDVHAQYGSVAAMIDGDPNPGYVDEDKRSNYTYYQSDDLYDGITYYYLDSENKLALDTDGNNKVYMGYAIFELNGLSAIEDVTVWLAGDNATEWKTPKTVWNMNDEYDILVSNDGETWTLLKSYTDMCGDGTNPGANFPAEGDDARAVGTDGKLGHKIALDGAEAKYFAIGVKSGMNSTNATGARNAIVFGEVTVNGTVVTPDAAKKTPAEIYAEAKDGDLLQTVNFKDMSWSDDYLNSDNWNTYAYVSEDGRTVKHLIHSSRTFGADNKRASWGGIAEDERFSLDNGETYTLYFDALLANNNKFGVGIQVDGGNTLLIDGNGKNYWYNWSTQKVSGSDTWDDKWAAHNGDTRGEKTSFAVEVDSITEEMTLYVADADGIYEKVRTLTYADADISGSLICRIYTISLSGTPNSTYWTEVSNLRIYKGLVAGDELNQIDRAAEYANANEGDLLQTLNFNELYWKNDFYSTSNNGADVDVARDGSSARLTVNGASYWRAMWGGLKGAYQYPLMDVVGTEPDPADSTKTIDVYGNYRKYTVMFDADFGNTSGGLTLLSIMIDGDYSITVDGNGNTKMWQWNTDMTNADPTNYPQENWSSGLWRSKSDKQTFAVEVDPENGAMTLYILDLDGVFYEVATYEGLSFDTDLNCRIRVSSYNHTLNGSEWVDVSNIQIYKGMPISTKEDRAAEYANAEYGNLLNTLNFADRFNWHQGMADENNYGADVVVSEDGSSVKLTVLNTSYKRAMWGGLDSAYPLMDVVDTEPDPDDPTKTIDVYGNYRKYTVIFDADFGNETGGRTLVGIQVDGSYTITVDGNGNTKLYTWNTCLSDTDPDNYPTYQWDAERSTMKEKSGKQQFALEVDPENGVMSLYILDNNNTFYEVGSFEGISFKTNLSCRIRVSGAVADNSWAEVSDVQIYKGLVAGQVQNVTGASVRLSNPTGIRFSSEFRKAMIDSLRATYGEENVNLGMIIAPTDYLTDTGVEFEMEALDACGELPDVKYVKVDAKTIHEDGAYYTINCALANVQEGNYNRRFSARAFIEVNGEVYKYADFNLENNSRSIAEVSRAAYGDLSDTKDSVDGGLKYSYEVTVGETVKYSPYTTEERNTLYNFFGLDTSSITVMTYNLEYKNSDSSGGWEGRNPASAIGTIVTADPDVVGLQEDTADWDSYVAELKNNGYKSVSSNYSSWKTWGNGWAKNDIYYKEDKFEIVNNFYGFMSFKDLDNEYTIEGYENVDMSIDVQGDAEGWFSDTDIGRTFSYVALKDKTSGKIILVVNTHLHYGDGTSSSDTNCDDDHILREYQSRLLAAWLEDQKATYSAQVVMGDMNAHTTSTNGKKVLSGYADSGLSFARDEALVKGDVGGTLDGTDYTVRQEWIFDHVLYRNATAVEYTVIDNMVDVDNTRYPSDHLPVYAKLIWN